MHLHPCHIKLLRDATATHTLAHWLMWRTIQYQLEIHVLHVLRNALHAMCSLVMHGLRVCGVCRSVIVLCADSLWKNDLTSDSSFHFQATLRRLTLAACCLHKALDCCIPGQQPSQRAARCPLALHGQQGAAGPRALRWPSQHPALLLRHPGNDRAGPGHMPPLASSLRVQRMGHPVRLLRRFRHLHCPQYLLLAARGKGCCRVTPCQHQQRRSCRGLRSAKREDRQA